jgi:hypothetical protein
MVLPIANPVHIVMAKPRHVEPVCKTSCDCEEFPPVNPFAMPPPPFSKFLERQNAIDRYVSAGIYGPKSPCPPAGRLVDVYA